jgi:hypothetical protein
MKDTSDIRFDNIRGGDVFTIPHDLIDELTENIYIKLSFPIHCDGEELNSFSVLDNELVAIEPEENVVLRNAKLVVED